MTFDFTKITISDEFDLTNGAATVVRSLQLLERQCQQLALTLKQSGDVNESRSYTEMADSIKNLKVEAKSTFGPFRTQ
jgi:hypothetical protein